MPTPTPATAAAAPSEPSITRRLILGPPGSVPSIASTSPAARVQPRVKRLSSSCARCVAWPMHSGMTRDGPPIRQAHRPGTSPTLGSALHLRREPWEGGFGSSIQSPPSLLLQPGGSPRSGRGCLSGRGEPLGGFGEPLLGPGATLNRSRLGLARVRLDRVHLRLLRVPDAYRDPTYTIEVRLHWSDADVFVRGRGGQDRLAEAWCSASTDRPHGASPRDPAQRRGRGPAGALTSLSERLGPDLVSGAPVNPSLDERAIRESTRGRGVTPSARCLPIATCSDPAGCCHTGIDQHGSDEAGPRNTTFLR